MFPTIFSLATEELGSRAACAVPVLCYAVMGAFGVWCYKARRNSASIPAAAA
jgi:hypothetical protein